MFVLRIRRLLAAVVALATSSLLLVAAPAAAGPITRGWPVLFPAELDLPNGFQPEGIAIAGTTAYFGSRLDGDIYAASLITGKGRVISQGPGTSSVGLKVDRHRRLFVSGGAAGNARVVDARSGDLLASYQFAEGVPPTTPSFVNDVVLTGRTAWFTDSQRPVLYGVPLGRHGRLPAAKSFITLQLTGDYEQVAGFNLNGISETPDGRALVVVQSATGLLFRVDPRTGLATKVDLGGATVANGDGLLLLGRTLYVVQNRDNQVAVVKLNRSGTRGTVQKELSSTSFDVPTTVAAFGPWLYLPNARFTTPATPDTTYWVTRDSPLKFCRGRLIDPKQQLGIHAVAESNVTLIAGLEVAPEGDSRTSRGRCRRLRSADSGPPEHERLRHAALPFAHLLLGHRAGSAPSTPIRSWRRSPGRSSVLSCTGRPARTWSPEPAARACSHPPITPTRSRPFRVSIGSSGHSNTAERRRSE